MFYQIFLSKQVKRCTIITYKKSIHELPHELPKDLRPRIFGNYEIPEKWLNIIGWKSSGPSSGKLNILLRLAKNSWEKEIKLFAMCAISHENYSLSQIFCDWLVWQTFLDFNSPQFPLNLISFTTLVTLTPLTVF